MITLPGLPESVRGDGPCSRCNTPDNIVWFTESVFWNAVIRAPGSPWADNEPVLCIPCFVVVATEMGYAPTGWRLLPEWPWRRDEQREEAERSERGRVLREARKKAGRTMGEEARRLGITVSALSDLETGRA